MSGLTIGQAQVWLSTFACDALDRQEHLNQLDAATGDGEHGSNLARGGLAIQAALRDTSATDLAQLLSAVGMGIVDSVGGASGALYGTLFLRLSDHGGGASQWSVSDLADAFDDALAAMCDLGRTRPGEKTLIDALAPAIDELRAHRDESVATACQAAAAAAAAGAAATATMSPLAGRGVYVGARGMGHVDAGATSMAMLFAALEGAASQSTTP